MEEFSAEVSAGSECIVGHGQLHGLADELVLRVPARPHPAVRQDQLRVHATSRVHSPATVLDIRRSLRTQVESMLS